MSCLKIFFFSPSLSLSAVSSLQVAVSRFSATVLDFPPVPRLLALITRLLVIVGHILPAAHRLRNGREPAAVRSGPNSAWLASALCS